MRGNSHPQLLTTHGDSLNRFDDMNKLPQITILFWIMKICATTFGETTGDLLSMTLHLGYAISSAIFIAILFATLIVQLFSNKYHPFLYWTVILATTLAGTTMSDYTDRTLGLGYAEGSLLLITILLVILSIWYLTEKSLSVTKIKSRKAEIFYWSAILFSNTLGTALGDFLSDKSGYGYIGAALMVTGLLFLVIMARYFTRISQVILFWIAFVLTRPFGATFGDLLTKPPASGGLGFGTIGSSLVIFAALGFLIVYASREGQVVSRSS